MKYAPIKIAAVLALGILGCNSQNSSIAPVTATVTHSGTSVTEGVITFMPEKGGKPGSGKINSDGTVTWTTYTEGDGLTKGPGKLTFTPPPIPIPENLKPGDSLPKHKLADLAPEEPSITVNDGSNTLTVELVKK
ncbi:hypothetical protein [Bremerella alba]|uniref:Lipoprotein n=1 Tax=Bremerella alba TaxID=980252 RepID=A0A7V9A6V7_9BACT|nr:hypothetical protein [Bremerella alba]MBA2114683.1 hypothetical protein [Bremerella alba]